MNISFLSYYDHVSLPSCNGVPDGIIYYVKEDEHFYGCDTLPNDFAKV
jgi:hypothetical protein